MFRAKNYETMSAFVRVMPRNTVAFFRTWCISACVMIMMMMMMMKSIV